MGKQDYDVIEAMEKNGGYATFQQLNQIIDFSSWKTKTPYASVRRIVQNNDAFFRIQPGLWALKAYENVVMQRFNIIGKSTRKREEQVEEFTHSYYQGIIVNMGNMRNYQTYVPPQDKNRKFLEQSLSEIVSLPQIYGFTYPEIVRSAKTIDVIWFNQRNLPNSFFEVEHTTNIEHSLNKFHELQDFNANFYIIASKDRNRQFTDVISSSIYKEIKDKVIFKNYEALVNQHNNEFELNCIRDRI